MNLTTRTTGSGFKKSDTVVLFLPEQDKKRAHAVPAALKFIADSIDLSHFKGKSAETAFIPLAGKPAVILCGIGKEKDIDAESLRRSAAGVSGICRDKSITGIIVIPPELKGMAGALVLESIAEGLFLSNYSYDKYKTGRNGNGKSLVKHAIFLTGEKKAPAILKKVEIISRNTLLCRDLINEISEKSDPLGIAREARTLARLPGVTCTVYGRKEIQKMKMGLLLAVNQGSRRPPALVVLTYRGNPRSKKFFSIIGKGITFDSGGMNLKPSGHIEDMRTDMAGAAAALFSLKAVAELKLPKNMYAVLPLTENMLSNDSYRPGDVFTAYDGTTVEIGNTDAEGRLILADALAFTEKRLKPECLVDIATLTGACVVTFGEIVAGYLTTDDDLGRLLEEAGAATGEVIWRLPLHKDYEENLKSDIADISNVSAEKNSGTIMGGIFLKKFVKTGKWAHLDIAGTARNSKPRGYRPKNATGFGVRLIVETVGRWKG